MPRRRPDRMRGDLRNFPRYSISEAAWYVRVPPTTLIAWTRGQDYVTKDGIHRTFEPVIELADPWNKLLSFYNLVEAHVLRSTTERGVPLRNVRKALEYIRQTIPGRHPLLAHDFEVSGKEIFIQHLGQTVNATRHGQLAMRKILDQYLQRIERDARGMPLRIFPIKSKRLVIDPQFSSGKPVVKDRGITASVLWGRNKTGESIPEIAKDYGLTELEVKEAIEEYDWKVAA
jgi:uncharacterized protein (DUF433 family)